MINLDKLIELINWLNEKEKTNKINSTLFLIQDKSLFRN